MRARTSGSFDASRPPIPLPKRTTSALWADSSEPYVWSTTPFMEVIDRFARSTAPRWRQTSERRVRAPRGRLGP